MHLFDSASLQQLLTTDQLRTIGTDAGDTPYLAAGYPAVELSSI
jgi:hypothetical protein